MIENKTTTKRLGFIYKNDNGKIKILINNKLVGPVITRQLFG